MMNRRHFLSHVAGGSALALSGLHFLGDLRAQQAALKKANKSLIILWMGGGPSHMDLWDLKPGQPTGGEFKTIKTPVSGIEISEILPETAKQFKHLSIIRSLVTNEGSHERGTTLLNTGRAPSPVVNYPAIGSVAAMQLASKDLALPAFIGIGGTAQRIGPGFLGMQYAPFTVQSPGQPPQNIRAPGLGDEQMTTERLRRRQRLFHTVEDNFSEGSLPHLKSSKPRRNEKERVAAEKEEAALREAAGSPAQQHSTVYGKAFDLTVSKLRTVFEIRNEKPEVIDAYGGTQNQFGMGCLLARKLVEQGVSCVEVDLGGWDMHGNIFPSLRRTGPNLDRGMGTLVKELVAKGLWKNTVLVWMGEFGRTPRINQNAGRDHWGRCWSVVVGGGAIKGGLVHGATSKDGMDLADQKDKVTTGDFFATLYKGLGIEPSTKVRDLGGRPIEIAEGKPVASLF